MSELFVETAGSGNDIALLHGWGMHGGVWDEVAEALAHDYRVTRVDLPGHGRSPIGVDPFTLDSLAQRVAEVVSPGAVILGWSLGGMVAAKIAQRNPNAVRGLMLVNSSPCFAQRDDWQHGMALSTLDQFASALASNYRMLLDTFVSLQSMGAIDSREQVRRLRDRLFAHGLPDTAALSGGLQLLRDVDARAEWGALMCPVRIILGDRDRVVPPTLGDALRILMPTAGISIFAGSAHAPFLSHFPEFVASVRGFLADVFAND